MCAFVAKLDAEARGHFDAGKCARMLLLSNTHDFESLTTPDDDELLNELLGHARRVVDERKGGAE